MVATFLIGWLSATVTLGTPLIFASVGEIITERTGNVNIGVEGMMLGGALSGIWATVLTGNPYIGLLVGTIAGLLMSAIHGILTISMKGNQIISGFGLYLFGIGITTFLGDAILEKSSVAGFDEVSIPLLVEIPILGPSLFRNYPIDFFGPVVVVLAWYLLFRTALGLEITAVGDDPETADTRGIPVASIRYLGVLIGGSLAGLAGADLSIAFTSLWSSGMVAGRGWIALALVIFAMWRPERALIGAYFFGAIEALATRNRLLGELIAPYSFGPTIDEVINFLIHPSIMRIYPYLFTVAILVLISRGSVSKQLSMPSAIFQPYIREAD